MATSSSPPAATQSPAAPTSPLPEDQRAAPIATEDTPAVTSIDLDALVAELKASLTSSQTLLQTQATRLSTLADIETELSQLKDQYAFLVAAKEAVEKQLQEQKALREAAEENVELLRGQVEQARRGVGILQQQEKERKRLSHLPPPSALVGIGIGSGDEEVLVDGAVKEKTSTASKRQSMIIGGGGGGGAARHRRQSSNSEHSDTLYANPAPQLSTSPNLASAPRVGGLRELRLGHTGGPGAAAGSVLSPTGSSFFEETTLPIAPAMTKRGSSSNVHLPPLPGSTNSSPSKPTAAVEETNRLRSEVAELSAKLAEAEEARQASDACLKALREFMAGGGEGDAPAKEDLLKNIRLPPLPTDKDPDEPAQENKKGAVGGAWGFKLWKQGAPNSPALSTTVEPPATPFDRLSPPISTRSSNTPQVLPTPGTELPTESGLNAVPSSSTPLASFVSGWTKGVSPGTPADRPPPQGRSLTSFFSRGKKDEGKEKEKEREKELPSKPEDVAEGGAEVEAAGLEPSPVIAEVKAQAEFQDKPVEGSAPSQETEHGKESSALLDQVTRMPESGEQETKEEGKVEGS